MDRNTIKVLDKGFGDMRVGERMLISSPEAISAYIRDIPKGMTVTPKEMRLALAREMGADNTCPVSTGIFLRIAVEEALLSNSEIDDSPLPFWRVVDEKHPVLRKLGIPAEEITRMRKQESIGQKTSFS